MAETIVPKFIILKLFACPKCNRPKFSHEDMLTEPDLQVLERQAIDLHCNHCDLKFNRIGSQAKWLQLVPWNP